MKPLLKQGTKQGVSMFLSISLCFWIATLIFPLEDGVYWKVIFYSMLLMACIAVMVIVSGIILTMWNALESFWANRKYHYPGELISTNCKTPMPRTKRPKEKRQ